MSELYNSICISSVKNTALRLAGISENPDCEKVNAVVDALADKKLNCTKCDRVIFYNQRLSYL